ncbi:MAG: CYTH domain-containing protein [Planctomycetota bacterium]|nr:CYTH domain-containing protein [Planctomycetota bacterium]
MRDQLESELKLRAHSPVGAIAVDAALNSLGVTYRRCARRHHQDYYLDDDAGSLRRGGVGLRLRASGATRILTCKLRGEGNDGMHVRREVEVTWDDVAPPRHAEDLPAPLREVVQPLTQARALAVRQRLVVERDVRVVSQDGNDIGELAVDSVRAHAGELQASFQEIELEVLTDISANKRVAQGLHDRLPVAFAVDDKPTFAASLLRLAAARSPSRGAPDSLRG